MRGKRKNQLVESSNSPKVRFDALAFTKKDRAILRCPVIQVAFYYFTTMVTFMVQNLILLMEIRQVVE